MNSQFDAEFSAALLGFNGEAVLYYQGISDTVAHEYADRMWRKYFPSE